MDDSPDGLVEWRGFAEVDGSGSRLLLSDGGPGGESWVMGGTERRG